MLSRLCSRVAPNASIRKRFARGSIWVLGGTLASQGSRLIAFMLAARLLGKEVFGELGMLQSTVGMAGVFAGLGIGLTATKHVAQYRKIDPSRAGRIVGLSSLIGVLSGFAFFLLVRIFAPRICSEVLNAPHLAPELEVAALLVWLNTFLGAQTGSLAGLEAFRSIAIASFSQGILVLPAIVVGVQVAGLYGAVVGLVIAVAVGCAVTQFLLLRECRAAGIDVSFRCSRSEGRLLASFSLPTLISGAMNIPVQWLAMTILVRQPGGYAEMGAFGAANQWRLLIIFLPVILERSVLPILTDLRARGDLVSYRRTMYSHLLLSSGLAALLAVPLAAGAPLIMGLYGEEFRSSWPALPLLAGAAVVASASIAVATVMVSRGAMWLALLANCFWATALIISASLLTPAYGAIGLGMAFLIAYAGQSSFHFIYCLWVDRSLRRARKAAPVPALIGDTGRSI